MRDIYPRWITTPKGLMNHHLAEVSHFVVALKHNRDRTLEISSDFSCKKAKKTSSRLMLHKSDLQAPYPA